MASNALESFSDSTVSSFRRMTTTQRATLGGVFLVIVGLVFVVSRMGGSTSMGILFSDLEPETAAGVVAELEDKGIPYELTSGGRVVWVPRQMVASTRLDLSAAGLPDTTDGWSILDNQGITSSEFDQRVGYQRAMEDELAATISVIDGVSMAKVHLVIPEQDLFVDDEIHPSASVLLQAGGDPIAPGQVQAIVNLVASAIEGMSTADVSVTDDAGRLLAGGDTEGVLGMETDNQTRMRTGFEADVETQLGELLTAVVGPGRAVVSVSAELDFDTVVRTEETFDEAVNAENETLPQSETTRLEQYGSLGDPDGGTVDIETEILDGPAAGADGGIADYRLDERDVVYALDKVVTSTETAPGAIRSLSVSVVIDEAVVDAARIGEIEEMVGAAVGADTDRGDVVSVSLLPFDVSLEEQEAAAAEALANGEGQGSTGSIIPLLRTVGALVMGFVVLLLGIVMLRRASRRQVIDAVDLESLSAGLDDSDETDSDDVEGGTSALGGGKSKQKEATEADLLELVANQPDDIAVVLRQWLAEPEASR